MFSYFSRWDSSVEHQKQMFKMMGKKIIHYLCSKFQWSWSMYVIFRPAYEIEDLTQMVIWILSKDPFASFTNFMWNEHECMILFFNFFLWPLKSDFAAFKVDIISMKNCTTVKEVIHTLQVPAIEEGSG